MIDSKFCVVLILQLYAVLKNRPAIFFGKLYALCHLLRV